MRSAVSRSLVLAGLLCAFIGCERSKKRDAAPEAPSVQGVEMSSPQLEARLEAVAAEAEERGFSAQGVVERDFLVEDDALVVPVNLPSERCEVFVAVGSVGLRELSAGVFDSGGSELASANKSGSGVALRFCPVVPGMHYVAVRAVSGDGLVALRRFEGPSGIALDIEELFAEPAPAWQDRGATP